MTILLFGPNGQLGWELQRALAPLGRVMTINRKLTRSLPADFADPQALAETVRALRPEIIVNAAAYTAVDRAETEPDLARRINAEAPSVLAREAAAQGALFVHYSTDYVFDGSGIAPRDETAATGPLNVYGQTKLDGERAIVASGCSHLIFRTSWLYGSYGTNFARTMLRLATERSEIAVVDDQIGAPTGADLVADVTAHAIRATQGRPSLAGIYHLAAAGETSWHGYADHIIEIARAAGVTMTLPPGTLRAVPSSDYGQAAVRPKNSRLATDRLRAAFDLGLPPWQAGVERVLREWLARRQDD